MARRRAPASSAFSTSSLTTDAGRSTTSPAAIWLTRLSSSRAIRGTRDATARRSARKRGEVRTRPVELAREAVLRPAHLVLLPPGRVGAELFGRERADAAPQRDVEKDLVGARERLLERLHERVHRRGDGAGSTRGVRAPREEGQHVR